VTTISSMDEPQVMRNSVTMAVGTVLSRVTGVARDIAMTAALGFFIVSDAYSLGNTLPNIIYILVIGGAVNAVFIPQLVRHMKSDDDDGKAFADRLLSLVGVVLLLLSVVAVLAAPMIVSIYATSGLSDKEYELAVAFARLCLPQIFFYGIFTMLHQVSNARGKFMVGAYAPILNNIIAIITFLAFLIVAHPQGAPLTSLSDTEVWWLGLGTTVGVMAQALVLIPAVIKTGYKFSFRRDWRGVGLGKSGKLAAWTLGLVAVNQIAYAVITRLATSANVLANDAGVVAAGLTTYQKAHLIFILPHSVITVSLVTALLPHLSRLAHDGDFHALGQQVSKAARTVLALIIPIAVFLGITAPEIAVLLFGNGVAGADAARVAGEVVTFFAVGIPAFSLIYVLFRAWYAMEDTRTPFWFAVIINVINLAIAVPLFNAAAVQDKVAMLAAAYSIAYTIATVLAWWWLGRSVAGLEAGRTLLLAIKVGAAAGVAGAAMWWLTSVFTLTSPLSLMFGLTALWLIGGVIFLGLASVLRVHEVNSVLGMVRAKLRK